MKQKDIVKALFNGKVKDYHAALKKSYPCYDQTHFCDKCSNGYFVYGCEFHCAAEEHHHRCSLRNKFAWYNKDV